VLKKKKDESDSNANTFLKGSNMECLYSMMSFGISYFPAKVSGELPIQEHQCWLQSRYRLEGNRNRNTDPGSSIFAESANNARAQESDKVTIIMTPGPLDVLFGRGKAVSENPANLRFRKIVESYMMQYNRSRRLEKGCIADAVVRAVRTHDGRFLKRHRDGGWEEVEEGPAREKAHHTFRNMRIKEKKLR
jgi:hypothetical protein